MFKTSKTLLLVATLLSAPAYALPNQPIEMVEVFATCSGRLSAMATRQRSHAEPDATENEKLRDTFELLLETTLPDALAAGVPQDQARRWRFGGWSEVATLLADVDYSLDQRRADMAQQLLRRHLASCRALLL